MDTLELVKTAYNALDEKLGTDISVIKISEISIMSDYFIIATGSSNAQMNALVDNVEEKVHEISNIIPKREGRGNDTWILLDYGDFIVHIFNKESREFYNLDKIWSDGEIINFD